MNENMNNLTITTEQSLERCLHNPDFSIASSQDLESMQECNLEARVGIVDDKDRPITDPARLLTQFSMDPYYVELRRRETFYNEIRALAKKIEDLLEDFEINHLLDFEREMGYKFRWEENLSDEIRYAFDDLEDRVQSALFAFRKSAVNHAWDLFELLGADDRKYEEVKMREELIRSFMNSDEFRRAVCSMIAQPPVDDDLPF